MKTQTKLFKRVNEFSDQLSQLASNVRNLRSYVQHDFDLMIKDGYCSDEDLRRSIDNLSKQHLKLLDQIPTSMRDQFTSLIHDMTMEISSHLKYINESTECEEYNESN